MPRANFDDWAEAWTQHSPLSPKDWGAGYGANESEYKVADLIRYLHGSGRPRAEESIAPKDWDTTYETRNGRATLRELAEAIVEPPPWQRDTRRG